MAKKITDAIRRERIQPILDYWVPALGLSDWQITWEISDKVPLKTLGGGYMGGVINVSGPYQTAHIKLTRLAIDNCALDSEVETLVIHELGHCVLHPILAALGKNVGSESRVYEDVHWEVEKAIDSLSTRLWALRHDDFGDPGPVTAEYSPLVRS